MLYVLSFIVLLMFTVTRPEVTEIHSVNRVGDLEIKNFGYKEDNSMSDREKNYADLLEELLIEGRFNGPNVRWDIQPEAGIPQDI